MAAALRRIAARFGVAGADAPVVLPEVLRAIPIERRDEGDARRTDETARADAGDASSSRAQRTGEGARPATSEVDSRSLTLALSRGERGAQLVQEARDHGLSAALLRAVDAHGIDLAAPQLAMLRRDAMNVAATAMKVRRLLVRTIDALAEEQLVPVLLKGPALSLRLYGDALVRPTTDVDLLVAPDEVDRASAAIQRKLALSRYEDPGEDDVFSHHHHLSFAGDAGLVELHFRLTSGFGTEPGREAIAPVFVDAEFEGRRVRYLAPDEELVYLAIHAAQHLFSRVSWLYDLKLLAASVALDEARVARLAQQSGMAGAVYAALFTARAVVGMPVSELLLERVRPRAVQPWMMEALFTDAAVVRGTWSHRKVPAFLVRTLLTEGVGEAARHFSEGATRSVKRWIRHG